MAIGDIVKSVIEAGGILGILIIVGNLIKVTPLQINLWDWLGRKIGDSFNRNLFDKLNQISERLIEIESKLDDHIAVDEKDKALERRLFMLTFAREILMGIRHTREEFVEVLATIDRYDLYCVSHPEFPNNRATCAKKLILDNYLERLEKADFLAEER